MACFYCGKRVSLVRQLNDPDFCCDEHRNRYHDLTRTALNRLMESRDQISTAPQPVRPAARRPPAAVVEAPAPPQPQPHPHPPERHERHERHEPPRRSQVRQMPRPVIATPPPAVQHTSSSVPMREMPRPVIVTPPPAPPPPQPHDLFMPAPWTGARDRVFDRAGVAGAADFPVATRYPASLTRRFAAAPPAAGRHALALARPAGAPPVPVAAPEAPFSVRGASTPGVAAPRFRLLGAGSYGFLPAAPRPRKRIARPRSAMAPRLGKRFPERLPQLAASVAFGVRSTSGLRPLTASLTGAVSGAAFCGFESWSGAAIRFPAPAFAPWREQPLPESVLCGWKLTLPPARSGTPVGPALACTPVGHASACLGGRGLQLAVPRSRIAGGIAACSSMAPPAPGRPAAIASSAAPGVSILAAPAVRLPQSEAPHRVHWLDAQVALAFPPRAVPRISPPLGGGEALVPIESAALGSAPAFQLTRSRLRAGFQAEGPVPLSPRAPIRRPSQPALDPAMLFAAAARLPIERAALVAPTIAPAVLTASTPSAARVPAAPRLALSEGATAAFRLPLFRSGDLQPGLAACAFGRCSTISAVPGARTVQDGFAGASFTAAPALPRLPGAHRRGRLDLSASVPIVFGRPARAAAAPAPPEQAAIAGRPAVFPEWRRIGRAAASLDAPAPRPLTVSPRRVLMRSADPVDLPAAMRVAELPIDAPFRAARAIGAAGFAVVPVGFVRFASHAAPASAGFAGRGGVIPASPCAALRRALAAWPAMVREIAAVRLPAAPRPAGSPAAALRAPVPPLFSPAAALASGIAGPGFGPAFSAKVHAIPAEFRRTPVEEPGFTVPDTRPAASTAAPRVRRSIDALPLGAIQARRAACVGNVRALAAPAEDFALAPALAVDSRPAPSARTIARGESLPVRSGAVNVRAAHAAAGFLFSPLAAALPVSLHRRSGHGLAAAAPFRSAVRLAGENPYPAAGGWLLAPQLPPRYGSLAGPHPVPFAAAPAAAGLADRVVCAARRRWLDFAPAVAIGFAPPEPVAPATAVPRPAVAPAGLAPPVPPSRQLCGRTLAIREAAVALGHRIQRTAAIDRSPLLPRPGYPVFSFAATEVADFDDDRTCARARPSERATLAPLVPPLGIRLAVIRALSACPPLRQPAPLHAGVPAPDRTPQVAGFRAKPALAAAKLQFDDLDRERLAEAAQEAYQPLRMFKTASRLFR